MYIRVHVSKYKRKFPLSDTIQTHLNPNQSNALSQSETLVSPLRLVVSNPDRFSWKIRGSNIGFAAEVCMRTPTLYTMAAREPYHYLRCNLPLEIEEDESSLSPVSIVCQFPPLSADHLKDFVEEDETLLGMILVQFQMKILKQLLLFCLNHSAETLMIQVGEDQGDYMGIYQRFVTYEDRIPMKSGKMIQMTIPVNPEILRKCTDFIDEIYEKFLQTLWRRQRKNAAIRAYLKSISALGFRV
jgi:hypothetical protein